MLIQILLTDISHFNDHILQMHPLMFLKGSYHDIYFASSFEVKYFDALYKVGTA